MTTLQDSQWIRIENPDGDSLNVVVVFTPHATEENYRVALNSQANRGDLPPYFWNAIGFGNTVPTAISAFVADLQRLSLAV